jgi:hypothetical protein
MQTELLNRQRWNTCVELANAIFEYIEGFPQPPPTAFRARLANPVEFETTAISQAPAPQNAVQVTGA